MKVIFQDLEDECNEANGVTVENVSGLDALLDSFRGRRPFSFELLGESGTMLTIAWSAEVACVQHGTSDGQPPYMMAVSDLASDPDSYVEFLTGGTPTPLSRRFCLPEAKVRDVILDFVQRGERSLKVEWEEV